AGMSTIYGPDGGEPIGFIEYRQTRHGDRLSSVRVAHFRDGSSDEDSAEARVEGTLEALAGRTIIREADGVPAVDVTIDVAGSRIAASWGRGARRRTLEERVALPKGTYWGPLIFIVLKNFDANAEDGRLVFRTVAPTPRPRVFDMELAGGPPAALQRARARPGAPPTMVASPARPPAPRALRGGGARPPGRRLRPRAPAARALRLSLRGRDPSLPGDRRDAPALLPRRVPRDRDPAARSR